MSDNIPPSVEVVKLWNPKEVITFLESKKDELFLYDEDIDIIKKNRVAGIDFLEFSQGDLGELGMLSGPAKRIMILVNKIKSEGQGEQKKEPQDLKRHLDIIAERLDGMSHEMKKIRLQSEVAWFSAPGLKTATEKGTFIKSNSTCINFPFKLTTTSQRKGYGKFKNPPSPEVPEKTLQEYFINECKPLQTFKDSKLVVEDVHSIPLLATRKPDFVFIERGCPLDALHVVAVGEIKKPDKQFSNADVGQAVSFGEKVLELQPRRAHVYVVLTDCRLIFIYKVTRCKFNIKKDLRFSYEYVMPENLKFEIKGHPPNGWRYLVTILECNREDLGWVDPSIEFNSDTVKLVRSINTGRTSIVYEGKLNDMDSVVVKLAKKEDYSSCFEVEKNMLQNLENIPHIPKLLLYKENSLVTSPLGTKVKNFQKEDIRNIIETLRIVHSRNIVHMDLRRYNFIRDDSGKILIIDWGYSVLKNGNGRFAGALECMPDDILKFLVNGEQITYLPYIDLICLVRSFYLMLHKPTKTDIKRISFNGVYDFKSRAKDALAFWSSHGKSDFWQKIHQEANDLNYDNLIKELEVLF
ncbi:hypothetical protein Glove_307g45 [Diversispora epigaea]|uniref:non-specific serine/threonine protein kinase n=1 Tax=Diversispora epigaea TaxID=1348612 RepID=A0A397HZH6_9GLOM|nr:hypothetical protein Glove_307g45 [Diversispora epigaea]